MGRPGGQITSAVSREMSRSYKARTTAGVHLRRRGCPAIDAAGPVERSAIPGATGQAQRVTGPGWLPLFMRLIRAELRRP